MKTYFLVFIGGGVGSLLRFFVSKWFNPLMLAFPLGTLMANCISCLLLGLFAGLIQAKYEDNHSYYAFLITGICGGFSTFSTFSNETLGLLKTGNYSLVLLNILFNVVLCIIFIIIGIKLIRYYI